MFVEWPVVQHGPRAGQLSQKWREGASETGHAQVKKHLVGHAIEAHFKETHRLLNYQTSRIAFIKCSLRCWVYSRCCRCHFLSSENFSSHTNSLYHAQAFQLCDKLHSANEFLLFLTPI